MLAEYVKEKKELFEIKLLDALQAYNYPKKLSDAMKYSVMNGGKRIRPILMYMICDLFKKEYKYIEDIAVALEFIHCYSLVHDDLPAMDNDMYRRGIYTTHIQYDEATAILVGDALLTESFKIISMSKNIDDKSKIEIISKISEYAGVNGMVGGQFVDIESENENIDFETLNYIHENKTGKLLTASIELPLIALNVDEYKKNKLIEYSKLIGIAFQIKDDILDIEGDFESTGKMASDEDNNKTTYPKLFGLDKSKKMLDEYLLKAKKIIEDNFNSEEIMIEITDYFGKRGN